MEIMVNLDWEKDTKSSTKTCFNLDLAPSHTLASMRLAANLILQKIRKRITTETRGLTCSAGVGNNFTLAKIAADVNKPDGQYEVGCSREEIINFISNLPTRKIPGS